MDLSNYTQPAFKISPARNGMESLIEDIVAECLGNKRVLAKRLAIAAKVLKWSESDLHALYAKRLDPKVRSYTGLVSWYATIKHT